MIDKSEYEALLLRLEKVEKMVSSSTAVQIEPKEDPYISRADACEYLKICSSTMTHIIKDGKLKAYTNSKGKGAKQRFLKSEVEAYARTNYKFSNIYHK